MLSNHFEKSKLASRAFSVPKYEIKRTCLKGAVIEGRGRKRHLFVCKQKLGFCFVFRAEKRREQDSRVFGM
jgi:hypothetical protein